MISFPTSDHRSTLAPSDSERECPSSKKDTEYVGGAGGGGPQSHLGVSSHNNDSDTGGSLSPSPRATRKRQVSIFLYYSH